MVNKIFKKADIITVFKENESFNCRGIITEHKENGNFKKKPHPTGVLSAPTYLYMGNALTLKAGDTLHFEEKSYRVLSAGLLKTFGSVFCMKAVLEIILEEGDM